MIRTGLGISFGFFLAFAAFRNLPTFVRPYSETFVVLLLLVLYLSYSAGRYWRFREGEQLLAAAVSRASAEARAEVKVAAAARATSSSEVHVHQGPRMITPEQVAAQWSNDFDDELSEELAQHYARELNEATVLADRRQLARPTRAVPDRRPASGSAIWIPRSPDDPA